MMSFDRDGQHVTIIKHRGGPGADMADASGQNVLRYRDGEGRDVTVVTDKPITRADAERMDKDARARLPQITAEAMNSARLKDKDVQVVVREARRQADEARREGDVARKEGDRARQYAEVIVKRMKDKDGNWSLGDGPDHHGFQVFTPDGNGGGFGAGEQAELHALREEMRGLREELRALKEELRAGPPR